MDRNTGEATFYNNELNNIFRLTRQDGGAPIVLKVQGGDVFFTVDVVPSFKFELIKLKGACSDLHTRLTNEIIQKHNIQYQDVKVLEILYYNKIFKYVLSTVCEDECSEELR